jgi:hypothetical protein
MACLQKFEMLADAEASIWCRRNFSRAGEGEATLKGYNGGISRHGVSTRTVAECIDPSFSG